MHEPQDWHNFLKRETQGAHQELEALSPWSTLQEEPFSFSSYKTILLIQSQIYQTLATCFGQANKPTALREPTQNLERLFRWLAADAQQNQLDFPSPPHSQLSLDGDEVFGACYVLSGSRLGHIWIYNRLNQIKVSWPPAFFELSSETAAHDFRMTLRYIDEHCCFTNSRNAVASGAIKAFQCASDITKRFQVPRSIQKPLISLTK